MTSEEKIIEIYKLNYALELLLFYVFFYFDLRLT